MKAAVESFSCGLHTSLLDLAERKLGLFFGFAVKLIDCPSKHQAIAAFGQESGICEIVVLYVLAGRGDDIFCTGQIAGLSAHR